jgi:hypothetical protein
MGFVYEAMDRERGARVALKTLRTPDAAAILLLKNEFRTIHDLSHPNLITPKELFEEGGQWFFTMELVDGVDFLSRVRPRGALPGPADEERLRDALAQLAVGLCALHDDHKVHRDIKPSNVLVAPDGRVQILDFGIVSDLAKERSEDEEGQLVGTIAYMAPEQGGGEAVTPAADWYAVGTMLYEALTGCLPFVGGAEVIARKSMEVPKAPKEIEPSAPDDLSELCSELLRIDPNERPEGYKVLHRLGVTQSAARMKAAPREGAFFGRRRELAAIQEAFGAVEGGGTVAMLVAGESGVGKSCLVREFTTRAVAQARALVLRGRCHERESLSFKAIDGVVDDLARYLAGLSDEDAAALLPDGAAALRSVFPVLGTIGVLRASEAAAFTAKSPQEARVEMFALLRALFTNVALYRRVVVAIDDLQWADADSLALLAEVLRPPSAPPLLVLASIRQATVRGGTAAVYEQLARLPGDVRWLNLEALPADDAREMIVRLLADAPEVSNAPRDVDAIYAEAKGHPLFIDELVRHRAAHESSVPARLDEALWERASRLSPPNRRLLEAVAVAGVPIAQHVVAKAAALDLGEVFDAIGALRAGNFVRTTGVYRKDTVEPYHDRVRESVLAHLDETSRKVWHGRLALALEQSGDVEPERLIPHWVGAGETRRAADQAVRAGDAAAHALAFDHAASLYRLALELGDAEGDAAIALQVKLAEALSASGRGAEAGDVYLEAAGEGTSIAAMDLRRRAAQELFCSGRIEDGDRVLRGVLKALGMRAPRSPLAIILSILFYGVLLAIRGLRFTARKAGSFSAKEMLRVEALHAAGMVGMMDHLRGRHFQMRSLVEAARLGEPGHYALALAHHAAAYAGEGTKVFARVMEMQRRVAAMAAELRDARVDAFSHLIVGYANHLTGDYKAARPAFERCEAILREQCVGVAYEIASVRFLLFRELAYAGDFAALGPRAAASVHESEAKGDHYAVVNLRTNAMTFLAIAADDEAAAERELELATAHLPKVGFHVQHAYVLLMRSHLHLYRGDPRATLAGLAAQEAALKRSLLLRLQSFRILFPEIRARALVATGDHAAHAQIERDLRIMEREGTRHGGAHAGVLRAALALRRGDRDEAIRRLEASERGFGEIGMDLLAAVARQRRGLIVSGDDGREIVAAAEAWLRSHGVASPEKMCALYAPGFDSVVPRSPSM